MADVEQWPAELIGYGRLQNYRYKPRSNRVSNEMSSGPPVTRLLSRDVIVDHYFDLKLTDGQLAYFEWWLVNRIGEGEDWFLIKLRSGAGLNECKAKFVQIGEAKRQGLSNVVSVQLMTRDRPELTLTQQQAELLARYDSLDVQESAVVGQQANEEWSSE